MPSKKEGNRSVKARSFGLKAKYVANLNKVKINKKMINRFITHKMVFGIFNLINMQAAKEKNFSITGNQFML